MAPQALHLPRAAQDVRRDVGALRCLPTLCPAEHWGLQNVDYRSKTFSCSQCGSEAYLTVIEPIKEAGMHDYRLDPIERPERHASAVARLTGRNGRAPVDYSGGELPGRKVDPRR